MEQDPFPWDAVAVFTAKVAVAVFALTAALVAVDRRHERQVAAEASRVRWTDAARWDK
jgi:hypothetical protein